MFNFLKLRKLTTGITALIIFLPIFTEHVLLDDGSVSVEHYSPFQLLAGYAFLGELFAFAMTLIVCLVIYFLVSLAIYLLIKLAKKFNLKKLTSI